jgi:hypothetical protein
MDAGISEQYLRQTSSTARHLHLIFPKYLLYTS